MKYAFRILIAVAATSLLASCASGPQPDNSQRAPGSKLGVLMLIDDQPKHVHVGTTALNTFEKPIAADWQFKQFIMQTVKSEMAGKADVMRLEVTEALKHKDGTLKVGWDVSIRDTVKEELERQANKHNLFAILVIEPNSQAVQASSTTVAGYGVTTRCFFKYCKAFYLDHVAARVTAIPVAKKYYPWGKDSDGNKLIKIDLSEGVEPVADQDLTVAKNRLFKAFSEKIGSALTKAGI